MISEDHVSFETAKLLKEKGFDEKTYVRTRTSLYKEQLLGLENREDITFYRAPSVIRFRIKWIWIHLKKS